MDEMLLVKCTNYIWVHEVTSILQANNIVFRQHDETTDQRNGAYGPIIGISIYVFEKDYEKAKAVTEPILNDMDHSIVCCPKCGSENIGLYKQYKNRDKLVNIIYLLSTLFILIAGIYMGYAFFLKTVTPIALVNYIAIGLFILGLVLAFIPMFYFKSYQCNDCNKRFQNK